jgi:type IV pilus assembly protein PilF
VSQLQQNALIVLLAVCAATGCVSSEPTARAPEPSDDAADTNYQLGAQYYRNGTYELAKDRLLRAIELDSRKAAYHSLLALTYIELDNPRLANESFNRAVRLEPNNKDVRNAYAVYLCQRRDFDEAMEQFDRAIGIRDNDTAWIEMTNAGVCVAQKPDLERAEQYFRDALERRSSYGEALIQLAALKQRTGDCLTARAFLQRYLATNPSSAPVLYLAVDIEKTCNDARAATDYSNQLLREFPDSAEARQLMQTGSP